MPDLQDVQSLLDVVGVDMAVGGGSDILVAELAADVKATQAAEISRTRELLRSWLAGSVG